MNSETLNKKLKGRNSIKFHPRFINAIKNPTSAIRKPIKLAEKILAKKQTIVYISGSLTHVPEPEKMRYERAVKLVNSLGAFAYAPHLYGTDPIKHPNVSSEEVRNLDFLWSVALPKFSIIFCDYLAFGVGIEMGWEEIFGIPSIKVIKFGRRLTRLAKGLYDNSKIIEYKNNKDLFSELKSEIIKLLAKKIGVV